MRTLPRIAAVCVLFGAVTNPLQGCQTRGGATLKDDGGTPTIATEGPSAPRLEARSPWYWVADDDVDLHMSYSGFRPDSGSADEGERFRRLAIGKKALEMIE